MSTLAPSALRCDATGKVCWSFRQVSEKVANKRRSRARHGARGDDRVSKYHCGDCGWWHFGHPAVRPKRVRR